MPLHLQFDLASISLHLENIAMNHRVVNYTEIVIQFVLPSLDGAWAAHPLSHIFEILDTEDAIANRPFRTSVVITARGNGPGAGYFEALERLKKIPDPGECNSDGRLALWLQQLRETHGCHW